MLHHNSELSTPRQQPAARPNGEAAPFPNGELQADRAVIKQFVSAIYRNCNGLDGWIALRSFSHRSEKCVLQEWVRFERGSAIIDALEAAGTRTANLPAPAVFAPPVCLFKTDENARHKNVAVGPVISVDLDEYPAEGKDRLERVLGRATVVVASGGKWTAPEGDHQDKLHLHWRLTRPATSQEELNKLKRARRLAVELGVPERARAQNNTTEKTKGDRSGVPVNHPYRMPGSWHTKGKPRLCRVVEIDHEREIDLDDALERLEAAAAAEGISLDAKSSSTKSDGAEIVEMQGMVDTHYVTGAAIYEDLDTELRAKFQDALDHDEELRNLWETGETGKPDKSASARRFALAAQMKAWRFSINELGALLWVWDHSINPGEDPSDKITDREISRVWVRSPRLPPKEAAWLDDLGDPPEEGSTSGRGERQPLKLVSFQEVAERDLSAAPAPLVKGLLTHGGFSVLYGESNTGKTFVAMDLAFHISAGVPWDGMKVSAVPVLYVAAEGSYGVELRVKALQRKFPKEAAGARFDLVLSGVDLFRKDADLTRLIEAVRTQGARFVVLDTLSRMLAGGDENSSTDMGALVRNIDALRQATGAHVMAVHHSGKNRERGARGHSLLRAAIDTEIEIADDTITVTKQRDLDRSYNRAFILEPVTLHLDEDGEPISSCTVRLVSKADLPPGDVTETERQIVEAMAALERENDRTAHTTKEITAYLDSEGDIRGEEAVRSRLRELARKRVVERPKRGFWRLKAVGKWSTELLDGDVYKRPTRSEAVETGQEDDRNVFQ